MSYGRAGQPCPPPTTGNLLLNTLALRAPADHERLLRVMEPFTPRIRDALGWPGQQPTYVFFPITGILSMLTALESGNMVEFATIGREGTTAVPVYLGIGGANIEIVSQMPGPCLRLKADRLAEEANRSPAFAALLHRYSGFLLAVAVQSVACNRAHSVERRLSRWLLVTHDQAGSDQFPITHEFLGQMLGTSRPAVTIAAGELQDAGLLSYRRGVMNILNRAGLEEIACECYFEVRARMTNLWA